MLYPPKLSTCSKHKRRKLVKTRYAKLRGALSASDVLICELCAQDSTSPQVEDKTDLAVKAIALKTPDDECYQDFSDFSQNGIVSGLLTKHPRMRLTCSLPTFDYLAYVRHSVEPRRSRGDRRHCSDRQASVREVVGVNLAANGTDTDYDSAKHVRARKRGSNSCDAGVFRKQRSGTGEKL